LAAQIPDLIPIRMLNQFVYCPRLAYLEWVQSEWAENLYTHEGTWAHRNVNRAPERGPREDDGELPANTRSLDLSSERLGLIGKLDLVEVGEGMAEPVEYKRGRLPPTGRPNDSDLVQLGAQAMLLRDNGWRCERGHFFYAQSREKVEVPVDDQLTRLVMETIADIRGRFASAVIPEPLIGSPKCGGCSLSGICLPDETQHMRGGLPEGGVRALLAPKDDALPFYIQSSGMSAGLSGEVLEIRDRNGAVARVRLLDLAQLCLVGNVQLSTQALRELACRSIPVCYFSFGGRFVAMTQGLGHKNVELRLQQYHVANDPQRCLRLAQRIVEAKILNCRTFLRRNARDLEPRTLDELKRLSKAASHAASLESLLGLEGLGARLYFQSLPLCFKSAAFHHAGYDFQGRNRRPPRDPVNAMLSWVYSLLTKDLTVTAAAIGFDPYLGFYHQPRYGKPALALDLMEEFRVLIADSVVLTAINNNLLGPNDFYFRAGGVSIQAGGRRALTEAYERRLEELVTHPWFGYRISYRRILYVQTRLLARHVAGEIENFPPFLTR